MTNTRPETRGVLSREEVDERAERAFQQIKGLRPWDRRRVLQRLERMNKDKEQVTI